jgi:hypothetical protein
MLSKKESKYKEIIPLANLIRDMHISRSELISFKAAVNETAETYGLTPSSAALDVINLIIDHNKKAHVLFLSALSKWDINFVFHIWNQSYDIP